MYTRDKNGHSSSEPSFTDRIKINHMGTYWLTTAKLSLIYLSTLWIFKVLLSQDPLELAQQSTHFLGLYIVLKIRVTRDQQGSLKIYLMLLDDISNFNIMINLYDIWYMEGELWLCQLIQQHHTFSIWHCAAAHSNTLVLSSLKS